MNFSLLEDFHTTWRDILVIGKTMERDGRKYHIVGMTLSDEARLYIIEPHLEPKVRRRKGIRNQRSILKEYGEGDCCYLHCSDFCLGRQQLNVRTGTGGPMNLDDYGTIQLFFDMMSAGWRIPEWLKDTDWDKLQLLTLTMDNVEELPEFTPDMPITITHGPVPLRHIVEKPVTLHVGKSRSFHFTDGYGDKVQCHINNVTLIDAWKDMEEQWKDPRLAERFTPKQLEQARKYSYDALKQNCPKGMCYVGIEYECSKDLNLTFYSKEYLQSLPEIHKGSALFVSMRLQPDKQTGTHDLPLKGCVIQTPVPPDTVKISAELFLYFEMVKAWTERVS